MSHKDLVTRASQNHYSALSVLDRQSLMYTNGYKIDYCGKDMLWDVSYELLDSLLLCNWKYVYIPAINAPVIDGFGKILSDRELEIYYLYRDSASLLTENCPGKL
jgi:hypothetical protein